MTTANITRWRLAHERGRKGAKGFNAEINSVTTMQKIGLGKVYQLFCDELNTLIEQLNESLAA